MLTSAPSASLDLLRAAIADSDYVDIVSDGRRRWAALFDFVAQGATELFPGIVGAIVTFEEGHDIDQIALFLQRESLTAAWAETFTQGRAQPCGPNPASKDLGHAGA
jgi:hypothetical protein